MPDSEGDGWMSTKEAAELLGYTISWTIQALRELGVECVRRNSEGKRAPLLWDRAKVERLFRERRPTNEKVALGLKHCGMCGKWKQKATEFHKRCFVCKACRPAYDRERKRNHTHTFANRKPDRQPPGPAALYVAPGKPPRPEDSLKYACMGIGFSHRPLPVIEGKRVDKRKAFCAGCTAPRCVHHPHLRPAQVRKAERMPRQPAEEWG